MRKHIFVFYLLLITQLLHAQNVIDLAGEWSFQIDKENKGIDEKWYARPLNDKINLPGSMPEKLKGERPSLQTQWTGSLYDSSFYYNPELEMFRRTGNIKFPFFLTPERRYVGAAWYKRKIHIPSSWKGKRVMLFLERPHIEKYQGELPADYEKLLTLKGIGHYTAGAIASIAYGIPVPAVDGNVLRVITRITADDTDIMKQAFRTQMEQQLKESMPKEAASAYNQALMELGATVCVPNGEPDCDNCPVQNICMAKKEGSQMAYPVKSKAKQRRIEKKTVFVIRDGSRVILNKRPEKGLLAGLYEFPNVEGHLSEEEALEYVKEMGLLPMRIQELEEAKHIFSHIEWQMAGYVIKVAQLEEDDSGLLFLEAEDCIQNYPVPSAFERYKKYIRKLF